MKRKGSRPGQWRSQRRHEDQEYTLNAADAAELLGISKHKLWLMRRHGGGPLYTMIGSSIRYRYLDVLDYIYIVQATKELAAEAKENLKLESSDG